MSGGVPSALPSAPSHWQTRATVRALVLTVPVTKPRHSRHSAPAQPVADCGNRDTGLAPGNRPMPAEMDLANGLPTIRSNRHRDRARAAPRRPAVDSHDLTRRAVHSPLGFPAGSTIGSAASSARPDGERRIVDAAGRRVGDPGHGPRIATCRASSTGVTEGRSTRIHAHTAHPWRTCRSAQSVRLQEACASLGGLRTK